MPDENTAPRSPIFTIRIVQEFQFEAATIAEAYSEMMRLAARVDERATLIEHRGMVAPATDEDAALLDAQTKPALEAPMT